jgi:hypothetical protein
MRNKVGVVDQRDNESALSVRRVADLCRIGLHVHKARREANRCLT